MVACVAGIAMRAPEPLRLSCVGLTQGGEEGGEAAGYEDALKAQVGRVSACLLRCAAGE